ncbi:Histone-lysine N-methyltransferase setd3 [Lobulomyces angularis]|nr:Histone-lysine N-methyltransferase setd3 [Lobulomyces angularis]
MEFEKLVKCIDNIQRNQPKDFLKSLIDCKDELIMQQKKNSVNFRNEKIKTKKKTDSLKCFRNWLSEKDSTFFTNLDIRPCSEGYGLFAKEDIKKGDLVLHLNSKLFITHKNYMDSQLGLLYKDDPLLKNNASLQLALFFMLERETNNSIYDPYFNVLPKFTELPMFWCFSDLSLLKGSSFYDEVSQLLKRVLMQYVYIYKLFERTNFYFFKNFTLDKFLYCIGIIMTRQNHVSTESYGDILALIPFYDMFNHQDGEISTEYINLSESSETYSNKDYPKDNQVYITYGNRSNQDLLIYSGFCSEKENFNDTFKFQLGLAKGDKLYNEKLNILNNMRVKNTGFFEISPHILHSNFQNAEIFKFLKVFFLDNIKDQNNEFSKEEQAKIMNFILNRCKLLLNVLKPLINSHDGDFKFLYSCYIRNMERKILTDVIDILEAEKETVVK